MSNQQQVDNLVELLDGYSQKGGHHLNVNVFTRETCLLYTSDAADELLV